MDIKTKTLLFFSSQQIRIFPQCSSWVVSFFHCRFKSHSFFNVSIVCQVPPWGPHLTSSLLIIRCLIDVLYLLLLVLLLVFKGGYTFGPFSSTKCQGNFTKIKICPRFVHFRMHNEMKFFFNFNSNFSYSILWNYNPGYNKNFDV